jgi:type IV pilus assembly protein PilC
MPLFSYTARDRSGQQHVDVIESSSRDTAVTALRQQGLLPLKIEPVKDKKTAGKSYSLNPFDYRSFNTKDIEHEFHQIAVMLRSGVSLLDALNMTLKHCRIGARSTWEDMAKKIQQGSSFSNAMADHPAFNQFTMQLIKVGEQTGNLGIVMDEAANEVKAARKLKKQIISALRSPTFSLFMAIGVVVLMMTNLIPEIKKLLKMMGKPMPPMTKALIDSSDWFLANGISILVMTIVAVVTFIAFYNWYPTRLFIDKYALKIPVFGYVLRLSGTVLFCRAMGLLLRSGVVMVDALATMEKLHVNKYMASRITFARNKVLQGGSLSEQMEIESGYMPLLLQMTRIGENSGTLDELLLEMMEYHDDLLKQAIDTLTGMIAPAMTIFVGGIIGFVYAAFLTAMFSAAGGSPK